MHASLDDPAGEFSSMDPEDFKTIFAEDAKGFYDGAKKSPHSHILSRVYGEYTLKNNVGIIAKQAELYRRTMKTQQGEAAMAALVDLPPGSGDTFDLNTSVLIGDMIPDDRYTTDERRNIILSASLSLIHI